jgi:hypothetical protein
LLDRRDSRRGGLNKFFVDYPMTFERIYLMGHAQALFIEEIGGPGTIRKLLEGAPRMCPGKPDKTKGDGGTRVAGFADLLTRQLGLTVGKLEERWHEWVLAKVDRQMSAKHSFAVLRRINNMADGEIDSFRLSPDRRTILYRTMDRQTGRGRLYLQDFDAPKSRVLIAEDQRPGLLSIHAGGAPNADLGRDILVYTGRVDANDVLFVARYERRTKGGRSELVVHPPVVHDLWRSYRMIEMAHPAVNGTDGAVAFVGLSHETGFLDVFKIKRPLERGATAVKVTNDMYAERDVRFAGDGALLFCSDRTPKGNYEIFRTDVTGASQITHFDHDVDVGDPVPGVNGDMLFSAAFDGVSQVHRLVDGTAVPLTDVPTGITTPAVDADGDLIALIVDVGRPALVRLSRDRWLQDPIAMGPAPLPGAPPWTLPLASPDARIEGVYEYEPYDPRNYRFGQGVLFGGSGPFWA